MRVCGIDGNRGLKNRSVCSLGVQQSKLFKGFDSVLHFFLIVTGLRIIFLKILGVISIPGGRTVNLEGRSTYTPTLRGPKKYIVTQ